MASPIVRVRIHPHEYRDSMVLMYFSVHLEKVPGVLQAVAIMGTEANKKLLMDLHLSSPQVAEAGPNDLIVAVRAADAEAASAAMTRLSDVILSQLEDRGREALDKIGRTSGKLELKRLLFEFYDSSRPSAALHDLMNLNEKMARESGLDLLEIVDRDGVILANYPDRARFGKKDEKISRIMASFPEKPVLTLEEGLRARGLCIKVGRSIPGFEPATVMAGGFLINDDFVGRLDANHGGF